RTF
ncbi:rhs element Vgr protein, partial [Escherichia coli EC1870]